MAKKSTKPKYKVPAGAKPISTQMDGFFICEEGNQVQGVLLEVFTPRGNGKFPPKPVYKIRVTANDPATRIMNKEIGETDADVDSIIGIDEKGYLKKLSQIAMGSEIFIVCTGKEDAAKIKGQQPAWTFDAYVINDARAKTGEGEDDVPF